MYSREYVKKCRAAAKSDTVVGEDPPLLLPQQTVKEERTLNLPPGGRGGTLFWKERVSITQWEWVCVGVFVFDTRVKLKLRTKRSSFHQFYPQSSANHSGVQQRCVSEAEFKGCAFLRHTRSSREGARRGERRGAEVQRDFVKQRGGKNVSPRLLRYLPHGGAAEHGRLPHSLRYGRNRLKK